MKIALRTIQALGKIITGESNISPYRSGPQLVEFFNQHGGNSLCEFLILSQEYQKSKITKN